MINKQIIKFYESSIRVKWYQTRKLMSYKYRTLVLFNLICFPQRQKSMGNSWTHIAKINLHFAIWGYVSNCFHAESCYLDFFFHLGKIHPYKYKKCKIARMKCGNEYQSWFTRLFILSIKACWYLERLYSCNGWIMTTPI